MHWPTLPAPTATIPPQASDKQERYSTSGEKQEKEELVQTHHGGLPDWRKHPGGSGALGAGGRGTASGG